MQHRRGWGVGILLGVFLGPVVLTGTAARAQNLLDDTEYLEELGEWRTHRVERLIAEDGWLSLVGLFWLESGENSIGSGSDNSVLLPAEKAPEEVGSLMVEGRIVGISVDPEAGVTHQGAPVDFMRMIPDSDGEPTTLVLGDLSFFIIDRGGRLAVRVKDRQSPARRAFKEIENYPIDAGWRFAAKFEPYDPPQKISIATINGALLDEPSSGALVFDLEDQTLRLDVLGEPGADSLFVIFSDETSGRETYGGGRYLYTSAPGPNGVVDLDFNRAYNPPCVFTDYATCPLPPRQNRLPVKIEAGEMKYKPR